MRVSACSVEPDPYTFTCTERAGYDGWRTLKEYNYVRDFPALILQLSSNQSQLQSNALEIQESLFYTRKLLISNSELPSATQAIIDALFQRKPKGLIISPTIYARLFRWTEI